MKGVLSLALAVIGFFVVQTYAAVTTSVKTLSELQTAVAVLQLREQIKPTDFYQLDARVRALETAESDGEARCELAPLVSAVGSGMHR